MIGRESMAGNDAIRAESWTVEAVFALKNTNILGVNKEPSITVFTGYNSVICTGEPFQRYCFVQV